MAELPSTKSVLIVSSSEKSGRVIASLMNPSLCYPIYFEKTGGGVRRKIQSMSFDLIVVNAPLSDEFGHDLAMDLAKETASGVILLVKSDIYDEICDRVGPEGVLTVTKPISSQIFNQTLRLAMAVSERMQKAERETLRLKNKLEEAKLVGRAKCLLMQYQKKEEAQAHRYIEKQAMDRRLSRKLVAEEIINLYEG
ncbi:MAG: ANTAR domain-containing protein [Clostridiales bacterium]|nr:ANTAR domain-containing protein [Clostridiales bacterium]